MSIRLLLGAMLVAVLSGCATQRIDKDRSALQAAAPRSILVVPVVNKSLDVDAPNYLLTTLSVPLAERGYYVFPVHTARTVLEQEGFYEADMVHAQPPAQLAKMFGADAVLFVTIRRWDAQYAVLATTVTVDFEYKLFGKDGTELWQSTQAIKYQPQNNNAGSPLASLIVAAINAAVVRAAPNYMPLARQANAQVFITGPDALPDGPYAQKR